MMVSSRQKLGRKHPCLGSAAYFLIIYLEYLKISPEKRVYHVNVSEGYRSEINKSSPRLVVAFQQG